MRIILIATLICTSCCLSCQQSNNNLAIATADAMPAAARNTRRVPATETPSASNIIYQSTDGGQTWHDVSNGLPTKFDPIRSVVRNGEIVLSSLNNGVYASYTGLTPPVWQSKTIVKGTVDNIFVLKSGLVIRDDQHNYLQEVMGTCAWIPAFQSLKEKMVFCMIESGNALVAGSEGGIIRSTDGGVSWDRVFDDQYILQIIESGGNLIAVGHTGMLVSGDGGKHWEKSPLVGVEVMKAGRFGGGGLFAIVNAATKRNERKSQVYTSVDNGKSWQAVDKAVLPFDFCTDFVQLGDQWVCCHAGGISASADQGKTWQPVLKWEGEDNRADLIVADGIIYAMMSFGC